jgi:hypothetical protein
MAAVNIADLTSSYRFDARVLHTGNQTAQLEWLMSQFRDRARDRSGAEITGQTFEGSSHTAQFRDATPGDHLKAIESAIEDLEAEIAGQVAKSLSRPFGFRFAPGREPAALLG